MADIILKIGPETKIKLKAYGLSNKEISEIATALIPEIEDRINSQYTMVVAPALRGKAGKGLANVDDSVFLAKLNSVLPDGDEVSY